MSLGARRSAPHACSDDAAVAGKSTAIDYAARRRRAIQRDIIARSLASRVASLSARSRPRSPDDFPVSLREGKTASSLRDP